MKDTNVYVDFSLNMEEGTSLFNVHATCSIYPEGVEQAITIGEASIYFFNPVRSSYSEACFDADCISYNLYNALINLENICAIESIHGLVATGHFINIIEEWQRKGLGKAFVEKMMQQLAILNVELVMLITNDLKETDFYKRLGFESLENSADIPLMYKFLNKAQIIYS
ncbi:GNAT family N-acetyltransferase [Psychrobacillus sp. NPDC058041]|uniref:GNAT family N-acetyltransferase n=1 Tax=Psychrobacillus sp. NPDC058041 TaxID=3346310 RepID=UPI0036D7CE4B